MDLTKLNTDVLRDLLKLTEQKADLQKQIAAIDSSLAALVSGTAGAAPVVRARRGRKPKAASEQPAKVKEPKTRGRRAGRRGALKERILALLAVAGADGMAVRDIAAKLGAKNQNIHVWFSTTGKKLKEVRKVGEARYAMVRA
jgi:hypothetical protein